MLIYQNITPLRFRGGVKKTGERGNKELMKKKKKKKENQQTNK